MGWVTKQAHRIPSSKTPPPPYLLRPQIIHSNRLHHPLLLGFHLRSENLNNSHHSRLKLWVMETNLFRHLPSEILLKDPYKHCHFLKSLKYLIACSRLYKPDRFPRLAASHKPSAYRATLLRPHRALFRRPKASNVERRKRSSEDSLAWPSFQYIPHQKKKKKNQPVKVWSPPPTFFFQWETNPHFKPTDCVLVFSTGEAHGSTGLWHSGCLTYLKFFPSKKPLIICTHPCLKGCRIRCMDPNKEFSRDSLLTNRSSINNPYLPLQRARLAKLQSANRLNFRA